MIITEIPVIDPTVTLAICIRKYRVGHVPNKIATTGRMDCNSEEKQNRNVKNSMQAAEEFMTYTAIHTAPRKLATHTAARNSGVLSRQDGFTR